MSAAQEQLSRASGGVLGSFAVMLAAVTLGVLQFVQHALPSPAVVRVPTSAVLFSLWVAILVPAVALTIVDRLLASGEGGPRRVRRFRTGVFIVAAVLFLRALQLYMSPVHALFEALDGVPLLPLAAFLVAAAAIVWACVRAYHGIHQYLVLASLSSVVLLGYAVIQMAPATALPDSYDTTAVSTGNPDLPPVFVLVFDEFSYRLAAGDSGRVDSDKFPNLAALADDSVWFTNATTNGFHTPYVVPPLVEGVTRLRPDYDITVYDQFAFVEQLLWDGCGVTYTCLGSNHLAASTTQVGQMLLARALWEAAPGATEEQLARAASAFGYDHAYPHTDDVGIHTFTPDLFELFIDDIDASSAGGRLFFYHPLLPHPPFVYQADGSLRTGGIHPRVAERGLERLWEQYSEQMMYTDTLLGRFVQELKSQGLYEDSVIIVTADHGFRKADPEVTEAIDVDDDVAHVPLLIRAPGLVPAVSGVDYQHIDFAATILDVVAGETPARDRGVSAFATDRPGREKVFYAASSDHTRYWEYTQTDAGAWSLVAERQGAIPGSWADESAAAVSSPPIPNP